jgi:hypothetical protein
VVRRESAGGTPLITGIRAALPNEESLMKNLGRQGKTFHNVSFCESRERTAFALHPDGWRGGLTAVKINYETADFDEAGPEMKLPNDGTEASPTDERRAAIQFFTVAIQMAAKSYSADPPDRARTAIRIALAGVIRLISDLYPDEPSFPLPLIQLRYGLLDLDHGKVVPFLKPTKVSHSPGTQLSEDLFRAIVAAAMTSLVAGKKLSLNEASRDIAKRLSKMGAKHWSGKAITHGQIGKWREKMMTERAVENAAVAHYEAAKQQVIGMEPLKAVDLMLSSLTDLSPANFPKKPPA